RSGTVRTIEERNSTDFTEGLKRSFPARISPSKPATSGLLYSQGNPSKTTLRLRRVVSPAGFTYVVGRRYQRMKADSQQQAKIRYAHSDPSAARRSAPDFAPRPLDRCPH